MHMQAKCNVTNPRSFRGRRAAAKSDKKGMGVDSLRTRERTARRSAGEWKSQDSDKMRAEEPRPRKARSCAGT